MRLTTYKGERSMADLTTRLFEIKGPHARADKKKLEEAILRANPHLRHLKKVPAGAMIVVPDVAGAVPAEPAAPIVGAGAEMGTQLRQVLKDARAALEKSIDREVETAKETIALMKSRQFKAAVKDAPSLHERLPNITKEAKADLEDAEARKTAHKEALTHLGKDLEAFLKLLS